MSSCHRLFQPLFRLIYLLHLPIGTHADTEEDESTYQADKDTYFREMLS